MSLMRIPTRAQFDDAKALVETLTPFPPEEVAAQMEAIHVARGRGEHCGCAECVAAFGDDFDTDGPWPDYLAPAPFGAQLDQGDQLDQLDQGEAIEAPPPAIGADQLAAIGAAVRAGMFNGGEAPAIGADQLDQLDQGSSSTSSPAIGADQLDQLDQGEAPP